MKKKTKITLVATTIMVLSLTTIMPQTMPQEPPQQPEVRPVSVLVDDSMGNTPPLSVEHQISKVVPSQNDQSGTQNEPINKLIEEQNITPPDNTLPQPTGKKETVNTPTPTTQTATKPSAPPASTSTEPKMGDTRTINGQKQSYFLGFGWVDYMGENEVIYCEGMYENGNKIGSMGGGTFVDGDGDINKMVGRMD